MTSRKTIRNKNLKENKTKQKKEREGRTKKNDIRDHYVGHGLTMAMTVSNMTVCI